MQRTFAVLVGAALLGLVGFQPALAELIAFDPGTMSYPVSVEQAKDSARIWAGDSGLTFTLNYISLAEESAPPLYVLKTMDGSHEFRVNCLTGEMVLWTDNVANEAYCAKLPPTYDESNQLPLATLHSIATQFLAAKYANYSNMNMESGNPGASACYYYQTLPNGAHYVSSFAVCVIDEWSGQVVRYCGEHGPPISIPVEPDVSSTQAEEIALDYAGLIPLHVGGSLVYPQSAFILDNHGVFVRTDDIGGQRLYREMAMVVHDRAGYTAQDYYEEAQNRSAGPTGEVMGILVDAHTGEVFYCEPGGPMGGAVGKLSPPAAAKVRSRRPDPAKLRRQPKFRKGELDIDGASCPSLMYPPLAVGRSGYLYVRYLATLFSGTVKASPGAIHLGIAGKGIVLRAGSSVLTVGGRAIRLAHPVLVIAGRAYVPSCAVKHISDADASWDSQARVLKIEPGSVPLAARFRALSLR